jgi:hypothetical protein
MPSLASAEAMCACLLACVQVGTVKVSMPGLQKLVAATKSNRKAKAKAAKAGAGGQ